MGNVLDSKPTTFSENTTNIQDGDYMQTYNQRPNKPSDHTDYVPWGNKGSLVQMGAKIVQDMDNKQLYITNTENQKVYITKNGVPLPSAQSIVSTAKNYGRGPCMQFVNSVSNPKIYMYTGDDQQPGTYYKPVLIQNMADFRDAMTRGNKGRGIDGKYSGNRGQAAISPFIKMGKDVWSGVADENRLLDTVGQQMILPVAEEVVGKVIPGFSTFM